MRKLSGWDPADPESLLDSAAPDTPLGRLLAAARGPAGPHELTGEQEAVAMLRSAIAAAEPVRRRRTSPRALVIWVGATSVLLAGSGLAVAGVTGTFPVPPFEDRPVGPAGPPETSVPAPVGGASERPAPARPGLGPASPEGTSTASPSRSGRPGERMAPPVPTGRNTAPAGQRGSGAPTGQVGAGGDRPNRPGRSPGGGTPPMAPVDQRLEGRH